jgi:non-specific serine/threonine protein kinase
MGERSLQGLASCLIQLGRLTEAAQRLRDSVLEARELDDWRGIGIAAEGLARERLAADDPDEAATLLGAGERIWRQTLGAVPSSLRADHDECMRATRERLGEARFADRWQRGAQLSMAATVTRMLGPAPGHALPSVRGEVASLTPREKQVLELIARGRRNRQIATELVISERTVESHVEHILAKLGLESRTQAAAWATRMAPGSSRRTNGPVD